MKLLGWMQHQLQRSCREPLKDFMIGNYCTCLPARPSLDDQESYSKPCFGSGYSSQSLKEPKQQAEKSSSEFKPKGGEENFTEETSMVIDEIFHGFLTIGTLGSEPIISEPATPTFAMSLENITEENTAATENDLKFINDELEKFLEAEAEEEWYNESPGRSSQVSTLTLSSNLMEGPNTKVCPLQGYLFGSSIELPETRTEVKKEKASLAELFHRTKIFDENAIEENEKTEMQANPIHKSSKHPIKKMLKKLHGFSRSSTSSTKTDPVSTKKKFHKVIQRFHRKIHPENSIAGRGLNKSHRLKINNTSTNDACNGGDLIHTNKSNRRFPLGSNSKEGIPCYSTGLEWHRNGIENSNCSGNKEHWIKTDADYLVLELQ